MGPGRGSVSSDLQVAVVDGRIAAVDADLSAWRGPDTEVVDLAGGMLHAGFVDAHIHPIQGDEWAPCLFHCYGRLA